MATWDTDAATTHPLDFRLVHDSFVTLFWRSTLLDETVAWLRSHAYRVVEFDGDSWSSDADMYDNVASVLDFPTISGATSTH